MVALVPRPGSKKTLFDALPGLDGVHGHPVVDVHVAPDAANDQVSVLVHPDADLGVAAVVDVLWDGRDVAAQPDLESSAAAFFESGAQPEEQLVAGLLAGVAVVVQGVGLEPVEGVDAEHNQLARDDLSEEVRSAVEGVHLLGGDEVSPDLVELSRLQRRAGGKQVVRVDVVVAQAGHDLHPAVEDGLLLLAVVHEGVDEVGHHPLVHVEDLCLRPRVGSVVVVADVVARPDDKVDVVLHVGAQPLQRGGVEVQRRVAAAHRVAVLVRHVHVRHHVFHLLVALLADRRPDDVQLVRMHVCDVQEPSVHDPGAREPVCVRGEDLHRVVRRQVHAPEQSCRVVCVCNRPHRASGLCAGRRRPPPSLVCLVFLVAGHHGVQRVEGCH